jgi:sigma-B regulation protein RsbU (phosphoserine phosphatase)
MDKAPLRNLFDLASGTWQERLTHISDTMRSISMHTDPQEMVAAYSSRMEGLLDIDRFLSLSRRGVDAPKFLVTRDSEREEKKNPWKQREQLPVVEGGLLWELMDAGEARVFNNFDADPSDPAFEYLRGHQTLAAIPVYDNGKAMNMVIVLKKEPDGLDPEILPQYVWTTNLFGRATHNLVLSNELRQAHTMLERESKIVGDIQRSLLPPELPDIPGIDLAAYYEPADNAGGDYYDFLPLPDNKWGFLIADVSGHGTPAAVLMAIMHALVHSHQNSVCCPGEMLAKLNHRLAERYTGPRGAFITAFFGVFDPSTRQAVYASAGHNPPRVKRCNDGSLFNLDVEPGLPLGIDGTEQYPVATATLDVGDQIIFYTDGLTEAFNPDGKLFGTERLDQTLTNCALTADGLIQTVLSDLEKFTDGRKADDDRTIVVAKITS